MEVRTEGTGNGGRVKTIFIKQGEELVIYLLGSQTQERRIDGVAVGSSDSWCPKVNSYQQTNVIFRSLANRRTIKKIIGIGFLL